MPYHVEDTIAAVASASGGAMRGIVRVSGPDAVRVALDAFRCEPPVVRESIASARRIQGSWQLAPPWGLVDCDLYLWPNRRSYTRQPSVEIHTYGSPPLLNAILASLCKRGTRLAEPGEFTLRAFLAGRLDLTQAEAVLGVIDAGNERELDKALVQLAGGLAKPLVMLRDSLTELVAHIEAAMDFAEEDLEWISRVEIRERLVAAVRTVAAIRRQLGGRAERDAIPRVVMAGLPNSGKSSLFNALLGEPAAIVSTLSGTTRDYVSRRTRFAGTQLQLIDTAGYAETHPSAVLARAGQQARGEQVETADLILLCVDATRPLHPWESSQIAQASDRDTLVVFTKCDAEGSLARSNESVETSSHTGRGIGELRREIARRLAAGSSDSEAVTATAVRCGESLRQTARALRRAQTSLRRRLGDELVAAELRESLDELGRVVGAVYTDDILDQIFRRFCIGK